MWVCVRAHHVKTLYPNRTDKGIPHDIRQESESTAKENHRAHENAGEGIE